ncbi:MAG: hypothetical protein MUC70_01475 [Bacteroidales bacterium]|jgi:hypothetical protein|nr:hypothetical protein [Bacteroidales bacterium]MCU0409950.1 hypothetical protein [Bacteroidales bacterium]
MSIRIIILSLLTLVSACKNAGTDAERTVVARAGDRMLYLDQIPSNLVISGLNETDSISAIQSYIRRWARKELLALRAEQNLTAEYKAEVNRQLDEMRNNLLIYQYQQQMIIQKMDTVVSESEMQDYYVGNLNTFTLTSNIVKALLIKMPAETPDLDKVRRLYKSSQTEDIHELEDYCLQFAIRYDDFDDEWITFTQLLMEVPLESDRQEEWLTRNSSAEMKDDHYVYFIVVREYRLRNSTAPFEYIRGQVKTIILNNRRNDFLQKLEDGIYSEAVRSSTLQIY